VPGGVFAPVWNLRDDQNVPWLAELSEIIGATSPPPALELPAELFEPAEASRFSSERETTPDGLVELIRSRSWYLTASPQRKAELETRVRELCATHPDLRGAERFGLRYITLAFRAYRR